MASRKLRSVLALLVALTMILTTVPVYVFAADTGDTMTDTAEQTVETQQVEPVVTGSDDTDESDDSEELNFMIDENGNKVDLTDDMREEIYSDDDTADTDNNSESGYVEVDADSFFEYDEEDGVTLASTDILSESFDGYDVGTTEIPGWDLTINSKSNITLDPASTYAPSTISVEDTPDGQKALYLDKNANQESGRYYAGDDTLTALYNLSAPMEGNVVVMSDVYIDQPGRIGMYFYGQCDDIAAAVTSSTTGGEDTIPYLGRAYFWDSGAVGNNPASNTANGVIFYDNGEKVQLSQESASWSTGAWYNVRFDINTDAGTYSASITAEDGTVVASKDNLALTASVLNSSRAVYGVALTVQNDIKSLGECYFKNVRIVDNNDAAQDSENVAADKNALSLPVGLDASTVTENFTLPIKGDYGSMITWTSSDSSIAAVDENGNVTITRPEYSGAAGVYATLTATLTCGLASATKSFSIRVIEQAPTDPEEIVKADKTLLELPSTISSSSVSENFTLPTKGVYGSTYTYVSSDSSVVSIDNSTGAVTVNKPVFDGGSSYAVTITATIAYGSISDTKDLGLYVKQDDPETDLEKAIYDATNALIGGVDITNIRQSSFFLDDEGTYGTLTWSSSDEDLVKITDNYNTSDPDPDTGDDGNGDTGTVTDKDGYKATVTRPDRNQTDATVILTVTANVNGQTATKDFELTIIKEDSLKAFPGVEGYGAYSTGGRGGQVYHVTNLNASGVGSLTYGLEELKGARTIVFDVGGVIDLTSKGDAIKIKGEKYSNVTVAGQTAPYPGITLKGYGISISSAHDVIIRDIKIRIGDVFETGAYNQADPMSIGNSKQVVVDHCSLQWAVDMDFRATGEYITLSNIMFGKNLTKNSPHEKGGHAYVGMINEGARKVSFIKNFLGDSTQRTPRITDADWIDAYNNLLYNCGNGFDLYNYEWQNKNSKMNVYSNLALKGPNLSNATPYRAGRGRAYSGGVMCYFADNYGKSTSKDLQKSASVSNTLAKTLYFGQTNESAGIDLSNMTFDEWNSDPRSYDNNNKSESAATFTYMTYPFPAPRGDVLETLSMDEYANDDNGMGATRPSRDLYDTMIIEELNGGTSTSASLTEDEVTPFFEQLESRTGEDYSTYKTARNWKVIQGVGPVLKGASSTIGSTKPVHWDDYTDVNRNTNPNATTKYETESTTDFEVTDWWGQYCGSPGQETIYTLYDTVLDRTFTTSDADYDQTRYQLVSVDEGYEAVERTVTDLIPSDWMREDYPEMAEFLDNYREKKYPYTEKYSNYDEYQKAKANGTLADFDYDTEYTSKKITWDGMGDGIPNWYKEYRGWSTSKYLASEIGDSGYTYLEEYLQMMAGDEPLDSDDTPATATNFKVNNLGYSTAQVYWNTDYRATCVIEYGTEPGVYTDSIALEYDETTDYYHTYHAQTLVGLQPDTTYYYKITSTDENSNVSVAEYDADATDDQKNMTFKTASQPSGGSTVLPTKPTVDDIVPYIGQARIEWTGDYATDESYEIYYDTVDHGQNYSEYAYKITGIDALTRKQTLSDLTNNTTYYGVLVAVNSNGKTASDMFSFVPSGTMIDLDFTKMTEEEKEDFMANEYMYILGGAISMQADPDTGENVLQMLDETNSHGVNMNVKLSRTQTQKFTYEVTMKILYQKQTDALNGQFYEMKSTFTNPWSGKKDANGNTWGSSIRRKSGVEESEIFAQRDADGNIVYDANGKIVMDDEKYYDYDSTEAAKYYESGKSLEDYVPYTTVRGADEHNTFQVNFSKDVLTTEDMDSTDSALWETAFSAYFDATTRSYSTKSLIYQDYLHNPDNRTEETRYDGTYEEPIFEFGSTEVGTYDIGETVCTAEDIYNIDDSSRLRSHGSNYEVEDDTKTLPVGIGSGGTGYPKSSYEFTTYAGDAVFSHNASTDKTLHAMWYYKKGSADFVTYKFVVDPEENNVRVYADGKPLYEMGEFSEDMEEPLNIGKIELKSRNDGYSWVNVKSIKVYSGDGSSSDSGNIKPVSSGTTSSTGTGYSGSSSSTATASPAPTEDPNATAEPTEAPTATMNPDTYKYFDDIADVQWAVEPINALAEQGIINGTGDRQYSPNDNVTRAEYVTMLMRAFGADTQAADYSFTDTASGEWYSDAIGKAVALGVVTGYDNGAFGVNDNITREDMMVMAHRTMSALGIAIPSNKEYTSFADQSSISDYALDAVEAMYCAGIINGVGDNMLDPKGIAERAQAAKIIYGLTEMEGTVNE